MKKTCLSDLLLLLLVFFCVTVFTDGKKKQIGKILMAKHTWKKKNMFYNSNVKKKKNSDSFFPTRKKKKRFLLFTHFQTWKKRILDLFFLVFSPKKTKQKANISLVWKQVWKGVKMSKQMFCQAKENIWALDIWIFLSKTAFWSSCASDLSDPAGVALPNIQF